MRESAGEFEAASVIFDGESPSAALAGKPDHAILRATMTSHIGQCLTKDSGQFAANWRRQTDLGDVADKLCSNASVLAVARHHAREKIHQVARVEIERLELLDQMSHVCGFVLYQLLDVEQFLFAFASGKAGTRTQRI